MSVSPPIPPNDSELMVILNGVWANTYWVKNALELYEGITQHAADLDAHTHFFALVQQFSLDAAALGICKLFDRSTPTYKKNTVPELVDYLTNNFTDDYVSRLDIRTLENLGICKADANYIVNNFHRGGALTAAKTNLLNLIRKTMPAPENSSLKTLVGYRNKFVAHQERVNDAVKEQLRYLPSLDEMTKINEWANNFCHLVAYVLTDTSFLSNGPSARMAALHVVAKVLDIDLDRASYQEREAFYKKS
jgi:hypothetical protein